MLINPFYYGEFQYPEGIAAKWYKGAHKPLISKVMFEEIQQGRGINKGVWGSKSFAFRGLLRCGGCGAAVTAEEKFKKLKSGDFNKHIYYRCTKKIDPNCPEKYISERELRPLIQEFITINVKQIGVNNKLQAQIEKHYSVTRSLLMHYKVEVVLDQPLVEYARYVLEKGTFNEMLGMAEGITTKLSFKGGCLSFN